MADGPTRKEQLDAAYRQCVSNAEREYQERRDEERMASMRARLYGFMGIETLAEQTFRKWEEFERKECLAEYKWRTRLSRV